MKKKLLIISAIVSLATSLSGQDRIEYTYDAMGNRVTRHVITLEPAVAVAASADRVKKNSSNPVEEKFKEQIVKIYPNPTKGALAVEITGGDDTELIEIQLFSMQGVKLQTLRATSGTTPIDMLPYPAGTYILRMLAGDRIKEMKIIKQ